MRKAKATCDTLIRKEERESDGYGYLYEIVMRRGESVACFRIPLYTVRVSLVHPGGETTSAEVTDAFADLGRAIHFFDKLVRNLATPIDLIYIHEDELCK